MLEKMVGRRRAGKTGGWRNKIMGYFWAGEARWAAVSREAWKADFAFNTCTYAGKPLAGDNVHRGYCPCPTSTADHWTHQTFHVVNVLKNQQAGSTCQSSGTRAGHPLPQPGGDAGSTSPPQVLAALLWKKEKLQPLHPQMFLGNECIKQARIASLTKALRC